MQSPVEERKEIDSQGLMMFYLHPQVTGSMIFPRALSIFQFLNLTPEAEISECGSVLTHLSLAVLVFITLSEFIEEVNFKCILKSSLRFQ